MIEKRLPSGSEKVAETPQAYTSGSACLNSTPLDFSSANAARQSSTFTNDGRVVSWAPLARPAIGVVGTDLEERKFEVLLLRSDSDPPVTTGRGEVSLLVEADLLSVVVQGGLLIFHDQRYLRDSCFHGPNITIYIYKHIDI